MTADPISTLADYVRAFESLDAEAVVPFYHLPCTFIAPQGGVVAPDAATARAVVAQLMQQARAQGYRRTETRDLAVRKLAANLATCSGTFVRFDDRDGEIARFGFTYVMRAEETAWRIAVAIAHDPYPAADLTGR